MRKETPLIPLRKTVLDALASSAILLVCVIATHGQAVSPNSGRQLFNILDYGAKNNASAPATEAFRRAIAAAKAAGGGTIFVPPGKYTSGPGVFLSVGPGELKSVAQSGNELQNARSPTEER